MGYFMNIDQCLKAAESLSGLTLKVAWVVIIKLFFYELVLNNVIILIKYCKMPYKNLDKALLFSKNQVFCLKIWQAPTTLQFNIFYWNFAQVSYSPMSTKGYVGFFIFCLHLELFAKIKKAWFLLTHFFIILLIAQDLNKINKKSGALFFRHY